MGRNGGRGEEGLKEDEGNYLVVQYDGLAATGLDRK